MYVILLNGNTYANFTTRFRNVDKIVQEYKERMQWLGYTLPEGEWSAKKYMKNSLDNYGN